MGSSFGAKNDKAGPASFTAVPDLACGFLILAAAVALYRSAFGHGFIQDDYALIDAAKNYFSPYGSFVLDFFGTYNFYRPITMGFLYFLSYSLFGMGPLGYHALTFAFFIMTCLLVYAIIKLLTGRWDAALVGSVFYLTRGALFTEIYWIGCGFTETGTVLFILSSVFLYLAYKKYGNRLLYLLSLAFFVLALMSKETGIVLPFLILAVDACYAGPRGNGGLKKAALRISPYLALAFLYLLRLVIIRSMIAAGPYRMSFTPNTVLGNFMFYVWNTFNSRIELAILSIFFLAALAAARDRKYAAMSVSWYLAGLAPVIFLGIHTFAYYLSLPLAGMAILLSLGAGRVFDLVPRVRYALALALIVLMMATVASAVASQEKQSAIIFQENTADRILSDIRESGQTFPDGGLIYVKNADYRVFAALGYGSSAIRLYYGNNVSIYFENVTDSLLVRHDRVYYYDYNNDSLSYMGEKDL